MVNLQLASQLLKKAIDNPEHVRAFGWSDHHITLLEEQAIELAKELHGVGVHQLPRCSPEQSERIERCIQAIKKERSDVNPWAVCQDKVGCAHARQTQEQEEEKFVKEFVEALEKAGRSHE